MLINIGLPAVKLSSACPGAGVLSERHEGGHLRSSTSQGVPGTAGVSSGQRRMSASSGAQLYYEPQRTWRRHFPPVLRHNSVE